MPPTGARHLRELAHGALRMRKDGLCNRGLNPKSMPRPKFARHAAEEC
jgi:hypothetical protein